ncbi:hypothetical protein K1719_016060 [Acacia pycnantha]|nr:hypothetical protein K1719_016060 [Acacia pycnantha]
MEVVNRVRDLVGPQLSQNLEIHQGDDLRDKEDLERVFNEKKFDVVIHFAGLKAVGESVAQPRKYFDNNIVDTINLFESYGKV